MKRFLIIFWFLMICFAGVSESGTWQDDFSQGLENWEKVGKDAEWKTADLTCVGDLADIADAGDRGLLVTGKENWDEFTLACTLTVENLSGGDGTGLIFHYQNLESYSWFGFSVAWTRYEEGLAGDRSQAEPSRIPVLTPIRLKVKVIGKQATCFANDEQIFQFKSKTNSGLAGFYLLGSKVAFSDFEISGPRIADGGPGFAVEPIEKLVTFWSKLKYQN